MLKRKTELKEQMGIAEEDDTAEQPAKRKAASK
jgi:hypothetical protein